MKITASMHTIVTPVHWYGPSSFAEYPPRGPFESRNHDGGRGKYPISGIAEFHVANKHASPDAAKHHNTNLFIPAVSFCLSIYYMPNTT